jgi:hypothetical protein
MSELSPTDMLNLPPAQLRIMRLMLRQREMLYTALLVEMENLPAEERLSRLEIDVNLRELVALGWLVREESPAQVLFKLGEITRTGTLSQTQETPSKAPSERPTSRHSGGRERLSNFWQAVDEVAAEQPSRPKVNIRSGLAAELSAAPEDEPPAPPPKRPKVVGKLFEELSAEPSDEGE